jgi:hypothetical protein
MKSLRDEIRLRRVKEGFNFICEADFIEKFANEELSQ